ncbi:hypothetical protein CapIbe_009994 [Capra ibex]
MSEKDEEMSFKPAPLLAAELSNLAFVSVPFPKQLDLTASVCNDIRQRNLTEYFVAVDVNNMLHLYASMLYERRILIICSKLSTLTACIHGSAAMLYPMFWQHVYIPVLPPHLLDYCWMTAIGFPVLFIIPRSRGSLGLCFDHCGVLSTQQDAQQVLSEKKDGKVRNMALDDVVILNVDTNTLETPFDDLQSLPNDVISSLKSRLKKVSTTTGDGVARAFLKAQAAFFGSYRNALKIEPGTGLRTLKDSVLFLRAMQDREKEEPITFCEEAFVSHYRSGAMRQFLQNATQLQLFKQFIDGRLDLLNSGEGFSDVFEEEINMGEYAGSDKLYHQWLSTVRKGSGAILNTVKTKANPAMKTVYKFDITENGCAPTTEEQLPKTAPSPLVEAKDPKFREDRRPITVHFGQVRPPRPHVVKRPKSNITVEARRTSVSSPDHLVRPLRHYAVFLSEDSSDDECQREEGPSPGFTESFFFSTPFEWPQPYRTLKESDSAGDEAESPEQRAREPVGPTPAPHDRAASIDLLEDVFSNLDMEVPLQPLGQAKSLEDLRTPKDLREQPGTFDYQRLDLGRSDRSRGTPGALKLAHPHSRLWSLGQDDMAIPSKLPTACPEKPLALLGNSLASPCRPQDRNGLLNPSDKEEVTTPTLGSITIPRPQGRKTPELGIVPPPPTARPAKLQAPSIALGNFSERLPAERERRAALSSTPFPGLLSSTAPQDPTELLQPLSLAPGASGSSSDALLALLDPLNTTWSGSSLPPGPTAPNGLEPALQPSAPREARDPFEDLLRKTKQDVSSAPAPGSVEQLRKQWETFE